ncbi:protein PAT1 homolog 2 [Lampris incognitus]|uniref:protein PAT1 homolog 2 n=1 Tax=Lampris incognitus TaxID=2546036 RepID=UPI0024B5C9CE|nr:protein PAT1 homolog 2 [Lampris incognitus]
MTQWSELYESWSEEEDVDMNCGLLQVMAEEDEEKNLYNDETFGMDLDGENPGEDPSNGFLQPLLPAPTPPPPPSPQKWRTRALTNGPLGQRGKVQWAGKGRARMFEDPAVMSIVEGKISLKSLDTAIVDCGSAVSGDVFDSDAHNTIVCVIDGNGGRRHRMPSNFLDSMHPWSSLRGRGDPRRPYSNRPFGQRSLTQVFPMMNTTPGSPCISQQPLSPQPVNNQPLTPKMMQLRFGAHSPRPSSFYSPLSNSVQHFRYPGPVTQLHPEHRRRFLNQKQETRHRKSKSWDPYCNLMSVKDKEWITRLQMIQLQCENPYLEDYYYQEFYRRMETKMAEEELGIRNKKEPLKLTTPYISKTGPYTPVVHIEGSLGQVAVSTCNSPRRAISAVHAASVQSQQEEHKDNSRQRLEVLKKIEEMFLVLLEVEEADRMNTTVVAETTEQRLTENPRRKVEQIFTQLQHHDALETGVEFLSCLLIPKGKKLLARLLPFLDHDSALEILYVVSAQLPTLMSRDMDESLPVLYTPLQTVIGVLTFSQLTKVLRDLTMSSESVATYECLALVCQNKFGLSLLYTLLSQGETLLSSGVPLEPSIGDFETWTDMIFQVAGQLSQCSLVEPLLLPSNLLTLFCRYVDKCTIHQLKNNMESATGFLALPS